MSVIKHINLYRNGAVLGSREAAVEKLKGFASDNQDSDLDGVAILARYNSTSGDTTIVKTIVGFVYEGSDKAHKSITIFDNEATDGEISKLKAEIESKIAELDVPDSPEANKFVTSVSEEDGKIVIKRAAVASSGKTVLVTKADGEDNFDVNFDVNIDNSTIVKDADSGVLSVASAALTQYVGEGSVKVSSANTSNNKTVSLKINSKDQVLSQTEDGLSATLSIEYDSSARKLQLKGSSGNVISNIDATAFVKDGMLNDTAVFTASANTQSITFSGSGNTHEYSGLTVNHHYLAFEFKIDNDDAAQPYKYEILDATSIIDVYNSGNGLKLDGHTFSVELAQGSEGFLTVDENGVKISGVQAAIDAAKTEVTKTSDDKHIDVTSAATEGHVTYTISSVDTASASGLSKEITDRENADKKIKESVGLDTDGNHTTTTGNYTSGATTVVEEIAALDTKVKENADNITALETKVTTNTNNITALETKVKKADDSESFLTIDEDGVKISGVADAIAAAAASAKTEVTKTSDDQHINVTSAETENGHVTYTISSVDTASASGLSNETSERKAADDNIEGSVGLNADGSHITTNGNYTSSAKTVVGEIAALDAQVKTNADKIAQNTPKESNAITVTQVGDGSTIAVKLSGTDSGLAIKDDGLAVDLSAIGLDCGDYY